MNKDEGYKRKGYVLAWRAAFMDHSSYPYYREKKEFTDFEALLDLYFQMHGKDKPREFNGEVIRVKRGQLLTSERELAKRWGWSKTKTSNFLKRVQNVDHWITKESDHRKTLVTWVDYDNWNPLDKEKKTTESEGKKTTEKPLKDHRPTTSNKRISKDNKRKKDSLCLKNEFSDEFSEEDLKLTNLFIELMEKNHPTLGILDGLIKACKRDGPHTCWMLREIDKRTNEQIERVIRFSQKDNYWKEWILGMAALRNKWDELWAGIEREDSGG